MIKIANAPCSWGVLEFEAKTESPGYGQVLDEIAADRLRRHRARRLGLHAHRPRGAAGRARRAAARDGRRVRHDAAGGLAVVRRRPASAPWRRRRLLAAVAREAPPVIVLSDEPTADPHRARAAGRVDASAEPPGRMVGHGGGRASSDIARAVRDETGLRTVFHHHCAAFVETPQEIDALMQRTDPALVGLCLDSGPCDLRRRLAGGPADAPSCSASGTCTSRTATRSVAARAARGGLGLSDRARARPVLRAREGIGRFRRPAAGAEGTGYDGWIVVEQDVLPAMGAPLDSARRNRRPRI